MDTNRTGFRWFSWIFVSFALDKSSLSIGRVKKPPSSSQKINDKQVKTLIIDLLYGIDIFGEYFG